MNRAIAPKNRATGLPRRGLSRRARPEPAAPVVLVWVTVPRLYIAGCTHAPQHVSGHTEHLCRIKRSVTSNFAGQEGLETPTAGYGGGRGYPGNAGRVPARRARSPS